MTTQAEPIRQFLAELAKLNALARLIEEAPIPVERIDHFYEVFEAAANMTGQNIHNLLASYEFYEAQVSLTDKAAFDQAHIRYFAKLDGISEEEYAFRFYNDDEYEWGE